MKKIERFIPIGIGSLSIIFYLRYLSPTLWGADAGDFASAVATRGIAHPPGYPLYTILGILTSFLPWGTLSWKMGLLSVIPSALTLLVVYLLLRQLTRTSIWSVIGVSLLAVLYPYWLYSVVVEAFALSTFFFVTLLYLLVVWQRDGKKKYLFTASFVFGLAMTHHHTILFLLPTLLLLFFRSSRSIGFRMKRRWYVWCFFFFLCGLFPYAYPLIAAKGAPEINWMGTPILTHFLGLITRAGYGTFRSAASIGNEPLFRLTQLVGVATLFYRDFRLAGCILVLIGMWRTWKKQRKVFVPLFTTILSYLFFYFYASFPLVNDFMMGVFERFIFPLYIVAIVFLTFGGMQVQEWVVSNVSRWTRKEKEKAPRPIVALSSFLVLIAFLMYPLGLYYLNGPKIRLIQHDRTLEQYGVDILKTVPRGSILLLSVDTPLFSTQYAHYVSGIRPDVTLIHVARLQSETPSDLRLHYPNILIPDLSVQDASFFSVFLRENSKRSPLYIGSLDTMGDRWVPWGLLYRYVPEGEHVEIETLKKENRRLWASYQDPLAGMLSTFRPFVIADIPVLYAISRRHIGTYMGVRDEWEEAAYHLTEAVRLDPADPETVSLYAQVLVHTNQCLEARNAITMREKLNVHDATTPLLLSLYARGCLHDEDAAARYQIQHEEALKRQQTPLKQLW